MLKKTVFVHMSSDDLDKVYYISLNEFNFINKTSSISLFINK
jgi:hypothetical protein